MGIYANVELIIGLINYHILEILKECLQYMVVFIVDEKYNLCYNRPTAFIQRLYSVNARRDGKTVLLLYI